MTANSGDFRSPSWRSSTFISINQKHPLWGAMTMNYKNNPFAPSDAEIAEKYSLDTQFELYLSLVKLDKRRMQPNQLKEMRQCFYAAVGQTMILMQEATEYDEADCHRVYDHLTKQVSQHFHKAILPNN